MVQAAPNRTELEGTIVSRAAHPSLPDFDILEVDVDRTSSVPDLADLLSSRRGSRIQLAVKRELLPPGPLQDMRIRCRAYLGGPDAILAEPSPEPGSFAVTDA